MRRKRLMCTKRHGGRFIFKSEDSEYSIRMRPFLGWIGLVILLSATTWAHAGIEECYSRVLREKFMLSRPRSERPTPLTVTTSVGTEGAKFDVSIFGTPYVIKGKTYVDFALVSDPTKIKRRIALSDL